ncbi:MAG: hypothetical protein ACNA7L_07665, partial [Roseinatronobacter sp.]
MTSKFENEARSTQNTPTKRQRPHRTVFACYTAICDNKAVFAKNATHTRTVFQAGIQQRDPFLNGSTRRNICRAL